MKTKEKKYAISLREQGKTFTEIIEHMKNKGYNVSRGSLSNWLKDIKLTDRQLEAIKEREEEGRQRGRDKIVEKIKGKKRQIIDYKNAFVLYQKGMTLQEIGDMYDVSAASIGRLFKRKGLECKREI